MRGKDTFPFDVMGWRDSRAVQRMSMSERGAYLEMMLEQWKHGPLVDNPEAVSLRIASSDSQAAEVVAAWPVVRRKFALLPDGRIQNLRLERERVQHATKIIIADDSPVVITFPTSGQPPTWELQHSQLVTWIGLYPAVNVEAECRKALAWVQANGAPKTAKGMPRFLVNWLSRSTDRRSAEKPITVERRATLWPAWHCQHQPECGNRTTCAFLDEKAKLKAVG